jgi:hypothetical protein
MFRELQLIEDTVSGKFQLLFIVVLTQSISKSKHRYKLERDTGALFWPQLIILAVGPKARGDILNSYRITGLHAHLCRGGGGVVTFMGIEFSEIPSCPSWDSCSASLSASCCCLGEGGLSLTLVLPE